jgi:septal ring factor EnvC (AmiA/AmiB activator)
MTDLRSGLRAAILCFLVCLSAAVALPVFSCRGAGAAEMDSDGRLEKQLAAERRKAEERKKSLRRMTEEELRLNANLALTAKRIEDLEKGIDDHTAHLKALDVEDQAVRKEYDALLKEQGKTEKAQAESLRLLWDVTLRRMAVGSRDMTEWSGPDREYVWSRELYAVLEGYRKELDARETVLIRLLGRREKLSKEIEQRLEAVNKEKTALLHNRLDYDRKLAELRRERGSAENELNQILKLVESLNFELSQRGPVDIAKLRGKLPWPVSGKLRKRFAPNAEPAVRGLGFAASEGSDVRTVAGGTVVHNDILRGFGTVVIVQHNEDFYSLYAYLGSSPLRVGERVRGNQRIGAVGFYPAIDGPGLYFELRNKKKAVNPEQWFGS